MVIADLVAWFETWSDPAWQENWDNCGWQVEPGVLNQPARVLVCLTPTLAVLQEALVLEANLIFAHHPLIFTPLKSLQVKDGGGGKMIGLAFQHQIGIYSAHTNFDQVTDGTAHVLAQLLALQEMQPLVPTHNGQGYGRVGHLPFALTLRALLDQIQVQLQPTQLCYSPALETQVIQKVAVLGGSGASYITAAVNAGAEAYLTSDCKFHQFQASRDQGLVLIDAGHYATERPACERLVQKLITWGVEWAKLAQSDEDFRQLHYAPERY
ncbi:GTP cyclohydrolase 1 type 2 homolog YbgI [uncultured Synechococcales cyanobacterium]|uniref:GTP cyclohydrolase 1 type 2 homolog n=1 Tax=uncultured Synechococcales cyanobacterium TaxID=1936017 RepID=A0A6J4VJY0_9CYAN|nr:GTP cyclohydrolase 1 type 2 homolog YbgI [uncultured Synechococcales cyanobacterium]